MDSLGFVGVSVSCRHILLPCSHGDSHHRECRHCSALFGHDIGDSFRIVSNRVPCSVYCLVLTQSTLPSAYAQDDHCYVAVSEESMPMVPALLRKAAVFRSCCHKFRCREDAGSEQIFGQTFRQEPRTVPSACRERLGSGVRVRMFEQQQNRICKRKWM